MKELSKKIAEMDYDGLMTDIVPAAEVRGGTIRKLATAGTLKRGTLLAKSSTDNALVILGTEAAGAETLIPDCILCDDTVVGTAADVKAAVYTAGCFDINKCAVAEGYTVTEADKDQLREYGIVFKAAAN